MELADLDVSAVKSEPESSAVESHDARKSIAALRPDVPVTLPYVRIERLKYLDVYRDISKTDAPAVKSEPGSPAQSEDEGEGACAPYTEVDISLPDIKMECLEYSGRTNQLTDTPAVKSEPGSPAQSCDEGEGDYAPYTEVDISLPDIKLECLEYSRRTDQRADLSRPRKPETTTRRRIDTFTRGEPVSCSQCSYTCNKRSLLRTHILTHTKLFSCSRCSYVSNHKNRLESHRLTHSGEKLFSCSLCTYACDRICDLKKHVSIHVGGNLFLCSQCTYACEIKSDLKRHVLTHSGERRQFGDESKRNGDLIRHMLNHYGVKKFACSKCSYANSRKCSLKQHILTHLG